METNRNLFRHHLPVAAGLAFAITLVLCSPVAQSKAAPDDTPAASPSRIDRYALVRRHNVVLDTAAPSTALQVGNGEIGFAVDITGLQTFYGNTMSHWGWHSFPLPAGKRAEDLKLTEFDTVRKVMLDWHWDRCWGWDFPMMAMAAARSGEPQLAVEALLHPSKKCHFNVAGLSTGGPFPYFPANGGLLYAAAMMAAGWDGAPSRNAPGFPEDGTWTVRWEGLKRAP